MYSFILSGKRFYLSIISNFVWLQNIAVNNFLIFLKHIWILVIVFHGSSLNTFAQSTYQYRVFTQEDGLASGTLSGISEDSTGFLWLMSENGLSRFDGYAFKVFRHDTHDPSSISSSNVYSMSIDSNKDIIFRTENSITQYTPSSNSFKSITTSKAQPGSLYYISDTNGYWMIKFSGISYTDYKTKTEKTYIFPDAFTFKKTTAVQQLGNNFWFNNGEKIICFNKTTKNFSTVPIIYLDQNKLLSVHENVLFFSNTKNEVCFFSTEGVFKFNNKTRTFNQYAKNSIDLSNNKIRKVKLVNEKYLAIQMRFDCVYSMDVSNGKLRSIQLRDLAFPLNKPIETFETINSHISTVWVSTSNAGVFLINLEKAIIVEHLFNNKNNINSLPSDNIEFMLENQGVLWMTSPGIGLLKAERDRPLLKPFRPQCNNASIKSTSSSNIRAIGELDQENLLIGTLAGLFCFNKTTHIFSSLLSPVTQKPVLETAPIGAITTHAGQNIYISSWGSEGVTILNYAKKKHLTIFPPQANTLPEFKSIRCMFLDSHNNLWFGTDGNVIYRLNTQIIDLDNINTFHFEKFEGKINAFDTLIFNFTFAFSENKNRQVLIGTQNGMYVYDYTTSKLKRYYNNTTDTFSISEDDVRCFQNDNSDNLWIGTHGGGLNLANSDYSAFKYFTRENGLPDNSIYTILNDNYGNLWLGTNRGISCFNPVSNYIRNYSLKDGLQNYEFNTNAAFKTSSGELVFGGINGFNIIDPDSVKIISNIPRLVISEFKVNDKDYPLSDNIILDYDQNFVSFQFAALSYFRSRENLYAYKMDGVNKNWIYCDRRKFSSYAGLAPGKYTFHVKACNYNGLWNQQGVSLNFIIQTPFWKTWWFKALIIVIIVAITYFTFRYRLRQKLQLELLRNKIARDLHDEIGSNLSSISLFSAAAKERHSKESTRVSPFLQKISEYAQSSQESINDIVWMINAKNDAFESIIIRMRKRAAEIFEATNIRLHINLDEVLNTVKINMDSRQNFYLIYKEALNNVVKYSNCKNVWISLQLENSIVSLTIKDDGTGFDLNKITHKNGIGNMRKRAELLKGYLDIKSLPDQGTSVVLTFHI